MTETKDPQKVATFRRQEHKYFIPNQLADVLIPQLLNHLQLDKHSIDGSYDIYSVYFDTYDLQAFTTKMDGLDRRQKFRVRSYVRNPAETDDVFVEIKEKVYATIVKRRIAMKLKDVRRLCAGMPQEEGLSNPVENEWRYARLRNNLRPCLLNSYKRRAFFSNEHPNLRVTIDRDVRFNFTHELNFSLPTRSVVWSPRNSVVEIKCDGYIPVYIAELIRRHNLTAQAISKYGDAVITNYMLNS